MRNLPINRMRTDAQSLADQIGAQTTEALIRSVSGVQQTMSEGLATAREGAETAAGQLGQAGQGISEGLQSVALPTTSARMAWRAGRFVGRIEGAVRLARFGVRFWWRRRQRRGQGQEPQPLQGWTRALVQWGPSAVAILYLAAQLWRRATRRAAST
jgi:hypothetical protein